MRQETRADAGPCSCGSMDVVIETSERNHPGVVADGDTVRCKTCGAEGWFCGAPSDGIGTRWDNQEET